MSIRRRWILVHQLAAAAIQRDLDANPDGYHDDEDENARIRAILAGMADRHITQAAKLLERQIRCSGR